MPTLDSATLVTVSMVIEVLLVLVLLHARLTRITYPGFDHWIAGTACWALGSTLSLVLRPVVPMFVAVIIGNILIMLHPLLLYEGISRFYQRPRRWWGMPLNLAILLAGSGIQLYFLVADDRILLRGANVSAIIGLLFLRTALEPLAIREARRHFMQWLLSVSLLPLVGLLLYRAFLLLNGTSMGTGMALIYQDSLLRLTLFYSISAEIILAYTYLSLTGDRVERELRDSEERFRSLAENSADIIWQLDVSLRYSYINEADVRLRGFSRDEVIGRPVTDFLTPKGTEQVLAANIERLRQEQMGQKTGPRRYEAQQVLKDGSYVWTEIHAVPLRDKQGRISGYVGITRDISARKSNERRQAELLSQEQQAREEQERFLSMLSHEYRTPLAILQSNIEILRMKLKSMPGHLEVNLGKMQRAVNRLLEVLERGRKKDGSESRIREMVPAELPIAPFLLEIRDEAVNYWGGGTLLFTGAVDEQLTIHADCQLLRTALLNLLENGVKYSATGSVITFESRYDDTYLEFRVHNRSKRALSVEPEELFRKYARGPNSTELVGTGVGLWLARQIIELHGGMIAFSVSNFHDVTVTVQLPRYRKHEKNEVHYAGDNTTNRPG
ncbi:PAS domain S-box protein [Trichlorobacter ammonificans]|uniref:histidine kinase n=1 Tax=Trichlorobacter ammonificans TaxID=2916410 RepID=A0ABM9D3K8_9BACT|nr:PAS domain S-box protein [Trichlorobacter ammonificans]CAH2029836.1 membrane protein of unknown function [Trichlorobacter ammonificans]